MSVKAVLFDMDGVLIDSLPAHLQYCERIAKEYGLDLSIPDTTEFKYSIVRSGVRVGPMFHFFRAIGFSDTDAGRADERYRNEFANERVELFPGVKSMLHTITAELELPTGIVTANVLRSVESGLGTAIEFFRRECIFTDDYAVNQGKQSYSKLEGISTATEMLGLTPSEVLYVGDQISDWRLAENAGTSFLGVTYGWGIAPEDTDFDHVGTPEDIARYVEAAG